MTATIQEYRIEIAGGRILRIELEDFDASRNPQPLLRAFDESGIVAWTATFPSSLPLDPSDSLVSVSVDGRRIFVNSFQCWRYEIDPESGAAFSKTFTK